jgi:cellulose synthase/poly-beta-1,6-N-acetylglucosamine synthase-like glycosyltransferase
LNEIIDEEFRLNSFEAFLWSLIGLLAIFYFTYYCLIIYEFKKPNNVRKQEIFPKVTLIIPTYNEEKTILRKLKNVKDLDYPKKMLEVLVVDSGSLDGTQEIVEDFMYQSPSELNLRMINQQQRMGKASAFNYACQHCHDEILILSDADAIFENNTIAKLVENFADPMVGAVTGRLIILNADQSSVTKLEKNYRNIFEILRVGESKMDSTPVFNGPIVAFRREIIEELDPETIADDTEISLKIRKKGWKAIYEPEAIAYEYTPTTFSSGLRQKVRRGHGIIQSFVRHKDFLFNSKYGKYGFVIFPSEFFMHIISPILILMALILTLVTLSVSPSMIIYFISIVASLLVLSGLMLLVRKIFAKSKNATINPISLLMTFLNHQICLLLSLSLFLLGKENYKWEKIDEIRTLCTRLNSNR